MITAISLVFMKLIIWPSFSVKVVNTIKAFVKNLLNFCTFFAMAFLNLTFPFEKQSIYNLVTILNLYCRLQCTATFSVEW